MAQPCPVQPAPCAARRPELRRRVATFAAALTLLAPAAPASATQQDADPSAEQQQGQQQAGEESAAVSLPDILGSGEITADTLTGLRDTLDRLTEARTPQGMAATYVGARDVINTMATALHGPVAGMGVENVGSELTLSIEGKINAPEGHAPGPGDQVKVDGPPRQNPAPAHLSQGAKVRVVTDVGTNIADGRNQITVGLIGIQSLGASAGEIDPARERGRGLRGAVDLAGPGTATEEHTGVVYAYVTPHEQPLPDQFPDITDPSTMQIGSTLRMMPVDANWSTWSTSSPGYHEDQVDVRFGQMFQVTRVSATEVEVATGPVSLHVDEYGGQISVLGTRLAVAPSEVKGTASLERHTYNLAEVDDTASYQNHLATGQPEAGQAPTTIDAEFGQFSFNGYVSLPALSTGTKPGAAGYAINVGADLTVIGQVPYSGYVAAEVHPPADADQAPTVTFSRFAPGVEITGTGTLVQDLDGNQYVTDTKVEMNIPDLSFMPHGGVITIDQAQLAKLNDALDPNNHEAVDLRGIFPDALPDEYPAPYANVALARGLEALMDLHVADGRFMVPGNVDYRQQPPFGPPPEPEPNPERAAVPPVPERNPGPAAPPLPERNPGPAAPPLPERGPGPVVPPLPERNPGPAAPPLPERGPGPVVPPLPERNAGPAAPPLPEPNTERAAPPPPDVTDTLRPDPGAGLDSSGVDGSESHGMADSGSDTDVGTSESDIADAAAAAGASVDFGSDGDVGDAGFGADGFDGSDIGDVSAASAAAAAVGSDADFGGAFGGDGGAGDADTGASGADADDTDTGGTGGSDSDTGGFDASNDGGNNTSGSVGASESDIADAAAAAGASVDFGSDGDVGDAGFGADGFDGSDIGDVSAASAAAAAVGSDADFSGAFGGDGGDGDAGGDGDDGGSGF